jgi:ElaB/YqjD/DUF883 family membrane-anchored ribosome-binding protein
MMANRLLEYEQSPSSDGSWSLASFPSSQALQKQAQSAFNQATRWVAEHPELALAGAVVTGVVLGWLIKRR